MLPFGSVHTNIKPPWPTPLPMFAVRRKHLSQKITYLLKSEMFLCTCKYHWFHCSVDWMMLRWLTWAIQVWKLGSQRTLVMHDNEEASCLWSLTAPGTAAWEVRQTRAAQLASHRLTLAQEALLCWPQAPAWLPPLSGLWPMLRSWTANKAQGCNSNFLPKKQLL